MIRACERSFLDFVVEHVIIKLVSTSSYRKFRRELHATRIPVVRIVLSNANSSQRGDLLASFITSYPWASLTKEGLLNLFEDANLLGQAFTLALRNGWYSKQGRVCAVRI